MTHPLSDSYCTTFNESKPPIPYSPGQEVWVRPHDPPPPTKGSRALTRDTAKERASKHPVERCLLHPPLRGGSIASTVIRLKILETIRVEDGQNAQLVVVQASSHITPNNSNAPPSDRCLVAKFYDPLYFDHEQDDADPFLCTDYYYTHEVAAYKALDPLQGTIIPKYYGSYTCELPILGGNQRSVRLILMEAVKGNSMQHLKPTDFSQSERQNIMKAIIDAESSLYSHDVSHGDLHPRNILVSGSATAISTLRVILIDFGNARLGRAPIWATPEEKQKYLPGIPISPLLRWNKAWWCDRQIVFDEWIDWDWQPWLEYHWSAGAFITAEMVSIWLPSYLTAPPRPPP